MLTRHSQLSRPEWHGLKVATRQLVVASGGLEAAAAACRLKHASLARHYSPEHPEMLPLDVIAELQRVAGVVPVTTALAHLSGHALVPLAAEPGESELLKQAGTLMRLAGQACMSAAEAMADGVLTPAECAQLSGELHAVVNAASSIMRWLSHVAANGLPQEEEG